ncbi:MAG: PEGA domain-containing protein [Patescibacteria group bacterium]
MKKVKTAVLILLGAILVIGLIFFLVGILKPRGAGILVESIPSSMVFIDGVQVGKTPYQETRKAAEVVIKLVPDSFDAPLAPYETKVTLVPGVETYVSRNFGESEERSGGEIVSFERIGGSDASLSVVTIPSTSQVVIDSKTRAFAPYKTSALSPGEHTLTVSSGGYDERSINVRAVSGYKLTVVIQLAQKDKEPEVEAVVTDTPPEEKQIEVEIGETGVGFLRVRDEPSTLSQEAGRVTPGERYLFIRKDEDTGWFLIEYEEGEEGWISNQYAEIVEEKEEGTEVAPTATPSVTLQPSP